MAANLVSRGHILGRVVMAYELTDSRDFTEGREFKFMASVTRHSIRHYEIDSRGELMLRLAVGIGYENDFLRDVIVNVSKEHDDVPNRPEGVGEDVVELMIQLMTLSLLKEHDGRLAGIVEWEAILDAPLEGRNYLRGEVGFRGGLASAG
ncbi:hypothetical protein CBR_g30483 [Chara braunii]|uniref:Uncharacterized protein n=1 Tax=Chara braunii TaxID=69332 RepID=A0A388LCU8_CHABU|nr:hypothetical protein CBR_g30483 [Chara braunii]|eukprot:GBG80116.1 hypothetical protein CBR_g30483 [Chara braunii]